MKPRLTPVIIGIIIIPILFNILGCQPQNIPNSELAKQSQITTMYHEYAREFPQVRGISAPKLQLLRQQKQNLVLIDVRSPAERAVSIIPGAITTQEFEKNLTEYTRNKAIVVAYCTIGYRSGKYAEKMRQKGINIFNLEGSILAWSHIQGKLTNADGMTDKIHVFGRQWQLTADNYQPVW